jgi:small subunit ribosomal protein S17
MPKRRLKGTVKSNKMEKTLVVRVETIKKHPKYKKIYKAHKNYKAHYEEGEYRVGDKVLIEECKPVSKDKSWRVIKKI